MSCEELRDLAPEIALGTIDGEERAEALRHLATCADCRRLVDQLSGVADELLLVAPLEDPPAGFESRVIDALGLQRRPRRRLGRRLALRLGPPVAAAAVSVVALMAVYHDDRVTAERYRDTLARAGGKYFQAAPLQDGTGAEAGVVFAYQGAPSWVLVTVEPGHRDRISGGELVTTDRRTIPLPSLELDRRDGSWGARSPRTCTTWPRSGCSATTLATCSRPPSRAAPNADAPTRRVAWPRLGLGLETGACWTTPTQARGRVSS